MKATSPSQFALSSVQMCVLHKIFLFYFLDMRGLCPFNIMADRRNSSTRSEGTAKNLMTWTTILETDSDFYFLCHFLIIRKLNSQL
jgi:hypothetical protein